MKKKYQVFISSTYSDLVHERTAVKDAILCMYHLPVGMEMFSAANDEQWNVIKETIDTSDYYVLIFGQRYGSVIETGSDKGMSYTEKEFLYADSKKIPILAFYLNDGVSVKLDSIEQNSSKRRKLDKFKERVKTDRTVEWFSTPDELARKVVVALHKEMDKGNRLGWVRGKVGSDDVDDEDDGYDKEDDFDAPVSTYELKKFDRPTDGEHKLLDGRGNTQKQGIWKDGELLKGTEFDWLIYVTQGCLIYKPDCPEDPYDGSSDFQYEKMEQYGDEELFPFHMSTPYIEHEGLDCFYVADMDVDDDKEKMTHIRSLKDFLSEKNPKILKHLIELSDIERGSK